jgi:hypothetical protein
MEFADRSYTGSVGPKGSEKSRNQTLEPGGSALTILLGELIVKVNVIRYDFF